MEVDGIKFPSRKEARRWAELQVLERAGVISDLERQVSIDLMGCNGPIRFFGSGRQARYIADFAYTENGARIIEDAKGLQTDVFKLKRAILAAQGITLRVT